MVGLSAIATALALSVVAAVADTGIKLGFSDITKRPAAADPPRRSPRNPSVPLPQPQVRSAQQVSELRRGQACLAQNGSQRAAGERSVQRHDDYPPVGMPQLCVTALRRGVREPERFKCANDFPTGNLRQGRTHAGCGSQSG